MNFSNNSLTNNKKTDQSGQVGTPLYLSPEQLDYNSNIELDEKVDIYSLGLILLELSSNITTTHEKHTSFAMVKKGELPKWSKLEGTPEGDLILTLTKKNAKHRPTAKEILNNFLPLWSATL